LCILPGYFLSYYFFFAWEFLDKRASIERGSCICGKFGQLVLQNDQLMISICSSITLTATLDGQIVIQICIALWTMDEQRSVFILFSWFTASRNGLQ
jgi:hypothetical protein